ncbi:MAG: ABC transporter permease [Planctomycetes bacterium]|nr:ABC transporter permease [Planctomycetota bacterium]
MQAELRAVRWMFLAYLVVLEVLLLLAVWFWPEVEKNLDALTDMAPIQMLKDLLQRVSDEGIVPYLTAQHFFKGCNAVGSVAAVLLAMGAVAGEAHRGTLELWLARPFSRRRILAERFLAGALVLVVPVFATTWSLPLLLELVHEEIELAPMLWCAVHQSLFLLGVYAAAFLCSCLSTTPLWIAFGFLVGAVFEFAIYMVPKVTHTSVFRLSDVEVYQRIHATGALDPALVIPMLATIAVLVVASDRAFARRTP